MRAFTSLASLCMVAVLGLPAVAQSFSFGDLCTKMDFRKEWRKLTSAQRNSYIAATLCMQQTEPRISGGVSQSRFDEYAETHIALTPEIHVVGQFLPWHRQMINLYMDEMRNTCGYVGPTPYWDWSIDADSTLPMPQWPIFDPITGFGGDGVPGTYTVPPDPDNVNDVPIIFDPTVYKGCVADGPFKDSVVRHGPHLLKTEHCLVRGFNETAYRRYITSASVNKALAKNTFAEFAAQMESMTEGIHVGGHFIVGGEMGNPYSSPSDPLFYLHHANLDRIWWKWQMANPISRMYQIAGFTTQMGSTPTTLDFVMPFDNLGDDMKVEKTMNSLFAPNCFMYMD